MTAACATLDATGQSLLDAILDDPDDDTSRLIYADWLEDRGHPYAAIIRKGVTGERDVALMLPGSRVHCHLEGETVVPWGMEWRYVRGFVEEVSTPLVAWQRHGPEIVRAHPVRDVKAIDREPYVGTSTAGNNGWLWMSAMRWDGRENENGSDELPSWLWPAYVAKHGGRHETREAALDALSAALIAWAKLPPERRGAAP